MRLLFLLFIIVPVIEMWLLIQVGSKIGALSTIALVLITAAAGLALLRQQGTDTLMRLNQRMENGQLPAGEVLEGVILAIGGALLLTPGFITDLVGFICLLPVSRALIVKALIRQGLVMAADGRGGGFYPPPGTGDADNGMGRPEQEGDLSPRKDKPAVGHTIEGDFRRED